jgi:hypothetical protein
MAGAGVAELAEAQDLAPCGVTPVEVQVLSSALAFFKNPLNTARTLINIDDFEFRAKVD